MSANGEDHADGTCDNCGAVGPLGWIVGLPDKTHRHARKRAECRDSLERAAGISRSALNAVHGE